MTRLSRIEGPFPLHTWQNGRDRAALRPEYFPIDDRTLVDRTARFHRIARLFCFPDRGNETVSDWGTILDKDVSFLLAEVALLDPSSQFVARRRVADLPDLLEEGADRIETWLHRMGDVPLAPYAQDIDGRFRSAIAKVLKEELGGLGLGGFSFKEKTRELLGGPISAPDAPQVERRFAESAMQRALLRISAAAQSIFAAAVTGGKTHPAEIGLALAFLQICGITQDAINELTEAHLDFYYSRLLGLTPRSAGDDLTIVDLSLVPSRGALSVPKGTRLGAGRDAAGQPVVFLTDRDITLTHAKISGLATLFLDRPDRPGASDILARPDAASADGLGAPLGPGQGWPIFGGPASYRRTPALQARFGLRVEAPALALAGGRRTLSLTLATQPGPDGTLADAVARYTNDRPSEPVSHAFALSISTPTGEREVDSFSISVVGDALAFKFTLPPSEPPLAPPEDDPSALPYVTISFRHGRTGQAAAAFAGLLVEKVDLALEVTGLSGLELTNSEGPLAGDQPFAPFGAVPPKGSLFTARHPELAKPGISRVSLNLEWANLPAPPADLTAHYQNWNIGLTNESFEVTFEAQGEAGWETLRDGILPSEDLPLFDILTTGGIAQSRRLSAEPADGPGPVNALRLQLTAPDVGFGRDAFLQVVADAATAAAKGVIARILDGTALSPTPMPKPPITPMAASATIDYSATAEVGVDPTAGRLIALLPFGTHAKGARPLPLADIPRQDGRSFAGTLYMGLDGTQPLERLTIHVNVEGAAGRARLATRPPEDLPELVWRYLDGDTWRDFARSAVESDGTEGFRGPGIVTLRLPSDWARPSGIMPPADLWLSVSVPTTHVASALGAAQGISLHAVGATRHREPGDAPPPAPVTAVLDGTVAAAISGVGSQRPALLGAPAETTEAFRIRVSERLSHKDRAVLFRDYERITLDAFPEIGDARAVRGPNGAVWLAVAPRRTASGSDLTVSDRLLGRIAEHLGARIPLNANRLVVRPVAPESIRVSAAAKLSTRAGPSTPAAVNRAAELAVAPWLADPSEPLPIGTGALTVATVSSAIEALDDVRQVLNLHLTRFFETEADPARLGETDGAPPKVHRLEDSARWSDPGGAMRPSEPLAVLVPAQRHRITLIDAEDDHRFLAPIGNAIVGQDSLAPSGWDRWQRTDDPIYLIRPEFAGIGNLAIGEELTVTTHRSGRLSPILPAVRAT
ncbi:MAG: hypothetical protein AAFU80_02095 [Pseudomonadota bacterium]